jgi:hypothetical protein
LPRFVAKIIAVAVPAIPNGLKSREVFAMDSATIYTVICGMPRCGTRQFTDFLSKDERICIQGEIKTSLIPYMRDLLLRADSEYDSGKQQKYFSRKRLEAVIQLFSLFSKGAKAFKPSASLHGFKTPNAELCYKELFSMILPSVDRLVFFYCIRNIKDCFLSLSAMPWFNRTPEQFIDRYIKSLKTAIKINKKTKKESSKTSIYTLHLDDFIAAEDKAHWLISKLYAPIGIDLPLARATDYIEKTGNRNSTVRMIGTKRETELAPDINAFFQTKKEKVNTIIAEFNTVFGTNLATL